MDPHALEEALTAMEIDWLDGNLDGDPGELHVCSMDVDEAEAAGDLISHTTLQGPR